MLFDDAPEEYLDPVLSTIMKDPYELPSSKTIIDYMTISNYNGLLKYRETSHERSSWSIQ